MNKRCGMRKKAGRVGERFVTGMREYSSQNGIIYNTDIRLDGID